MPQSNVMPDVRAAKKSASRERRAAFAGAVRTRAAHEGIRLPAPLEKELTCAASSGGGLTLGLRKRGLQDIHLKIIVDALREHPCERSKALRRGLASSGARASVRPEFAADLPRYRDQCAASAVWRATASAPIRPLLARPAVRCLHCLARHRLRAHPSTADSTGAVSRSCLATVVPCRRRLGHHRAPPNCPPSRHSPHALPTLTQPPARFVYCEASKKWTYRTIPTCPIWAQATSLS